MQNLEHRKDRLFRVIKEIKQEELFNSLEKMIYDLVEYSNPALFLLEGVIFTIIASCRDSK